MTPRKDFRFILQLDGADAFLIQEITPPAVEFNENTHGRPGNLPDAKTPGKMKVGELVVTKLKPADRADAWAWDWFAKGITGLQENFQKTGFLKEIGTDAVTPVETFYLGNIWPKKIEQSKFSTAGGGGNVIETVTFAVEYYFPTSSAQFLALFGGSAAAAAGAAFSAGRP